MAKAVAITLLIIFALCGLYPAYAQEIPVAVGDIVEGQIAEGEYGAPRYTVHLDAGQKVL